MRPAVAVVPPEATSPRLRGSYSNINSALIAELCLQENWRASRTLACSKTSVPRATRRRDTEKLPLQSSQQNRGSLKLSARRRHPDYGCLGIKSTYRTVQHRASTRGGCLFQLEQSVCGTRWTSTGNPREDKHVSTQPGCCSVDCYASSSNRFRTKRARSREPVWPECESNHAITHGPGSCGPKRKHQGHA